MIKDQNYYKKLYAKFINSRRNLIRDGFIERHHIKPKCIGGSNEPLNIIELTPREHFFAHLLLYKIYPTNIKIAKGLSAMAYGNKKKLNSWQYAFIKNAITKKIPPLLDLYNLYFKKNLSYKKIGKLYHVSDMTVCKWFKIYKLNTGKIKKENNKYKYSFDEETIKYLFTQGKIKAIKDYYKVSSSMAYEWVKICNILLPERRGIIKPKPCKEELLSLYTQNYTIKEMAKTYNVSMSLMRKWIKYYNFKNQNRLMRRRSLRNS
jgi:transposase